MTIDDIHEWFQLAAQAMFASVALGEWRFYECEAGPGCSWPPVLSEDGTYFMYSPACYVGTEFDLSRYEPAGGVH